MTVVLGKLAEFRADESGATAVEYGLIGALVAVTIIGGMTVFGGSLANMFNMISTRSQDAMGG
jgi:pilus assembly protein Flp/PilA